MDYSQIIILPKFIQKCKVTSSNNANHSPPTPFGTASEVTLPAPCILSTNLTRDIGYTSNYAKKNG